MRTADGSSQVQTKQLAPNESHAERNRRKAFVLGATHRPTDSRSRHSWTAAGLRDPQGLRMTCSVSNRAARPGRSRVIFLRDSLTGSKDGETESVEFVDCI